MAFGCKFFHLNHHLWLSKTCKRTSFTRCIFLPIAGSARFFFVWSYFFTDSISGERFALPIFNILLSKYEATNSKWNAYYHNIIAHKTLRSYKEQWNIILLFLYQRPSAKAKLWNLIDTTNRLRIIVDMITSDDILSVRPKKAQSIHDKWMFRKLSTKLVNLFDGNKRHRFLGNSIQESR